MLGCPRNLVINVITFLINPKDPGVSQEKDHPYNPIVGMGLGPSNLRFFGRGMDPYREIS